MTRPPRLVHLNGAPGTGKSTIAAALAEREPLALALDVDRLKHDLGGWTEDPGAAGLQARRLALATARQHLEDGHDVLVPQFAARPAFPDQLAALAAGIGVHHHEILLDVDAETLRRRLLARRARPTRPEQATNDAGTGIRDALEALSALRTLGRGRPSLVRIDARGEPGRTEQRVLAVLDAA